MELKDSQGIFNKPVNVSVTARLAEILSLHCIKMMQKKTFTQTHEAALFRIIPHLCLLITSNHAVFPSLCLVSFVSMNSSVGFVKRFLNVVREHVFISGSLLKHRSVVRIIFKVFLQHEK